MGLSWSKFKQGQLVLGRVVLGLNCPDSCQNFHPRKVKLKCVLILYMARTFRKYVSHCSGIYLFVTLMGNFIWGPISRDNFVST